MYYHPKPAASHAAALRPGQLRHVIRVASITGRQPIRDVMLLWLTHSTGVRVTELASIEIHDLLHPSGQMSEEVYLRADLADKVPEQHKTNWPDKCPITRRDFFMEIDGVPTYGGPYDSYTIPEMLGTPEQPWHDRELFVRRFDHDRGCWVDDEIISQRVIHDGVLDDLLGREELSIPEGWQLVPVEPAFAMLAADGCKEHHEGQECTFHKNRRRIWAAMLAAAPKHQGGEPCALESRSSSPD